MHNCIAHVNITRRIIFLDDEVEIFSSSGFFTVLSKILNILQSIFGIGVELLGKSSNERFAMGSAVIGT